MWGAINAAPSLTVLANLNGTLCGISIVRVMPTPRTKEDRKPPPSATITAAAIFGTMSRLNLASSCRAASGGGGADASTIDK